MKHDTIDAMSYLIAANFELGLKVALPRAYSDDNRLRCYFLQILTRVIHLTPNVVLPTSKSPSSEQPLYSDFLELIFEEDMSIIVALSQICPSHMMDGMANTIYDLFAHHGKLLPMIVEVSRAEVEQTDLPSNIFRRNSVCSKILSRYAQAELTNYFDNCLKPILEQLADSQDSYIEYEMDPDRTDPILIPQHQGNLEALTQSFLDNIFGHVALFTKGLRFIIHKIHDLTQKKFAHVNAGRNAVSGFIFLRLICPMIAASSGTKLCPKPINSQNLKRGLIMVTKIIQNLANFMPFGGKEYFMEPFNAFLEHNNNSLIAYIDKIAAFEDMPVQVASKELNDSKYEIQLASIVETNMEQLKPLSMRGHTTRRKSFIANSFRPTIDRALFDKLLATLEQIGRIQNVREVEKTAPTKKAVTSAHTKLAQGSKLLNDFAKAQESKGVEKHIDAINSSGIFYLSGFSKDGRPVLYYNANAFIHNDFEIEFVFYALLLLLQSLSGKSFDLLLDSTLFCYENEWDPSYIEMLEKLIPGVKYQLANVFVLSCSSYFKTHSKRILRFTASKSGRTFVFSSINELNEFIPAGQLKLHPKSAALLAQQGRNFVNVGLIADRTTTLCNVTIFSEHFGIYTQKKAEIFGTEGICADYYPLSEVQSVTCTNGEEKGNFIVEIVKKRQGGNHECPTSLSIQMSCPTQQPLMETIKANISRLTLTNPTLLVDERTLAAETITASLLNMSMLNLASSDPQLRASSYHLLATLSGLLYNEDDLKLVHVEFMGLPPRITDFAENVSAVLAQSLKHMSLDFISEVFSTLGKSQPELKSHALAYVSPWIKNLPLFIPSGDHRAAEIASSEQRLRDLLVILINISLSEKNVFFV